MNTHSAAAFHSYLILLCDILLHCLECLVEIPDDVVDMLRTDGEADCGAFDTGVQQLLLCHLRMCRACRMDDERFDIGNVCKQGENLEVVDEFLRLFFSALDFKCKDGDTSVGEVFLVKLMVWMILK